MNASVDSASRWNERYARDDYLYGESPNAFLRANAHRLAAGQSALCVADGDGRNSVWLAEHLAPHEFKRQHHPSPNLAVLQE
jgi:hypothetical protein